ncbi:zf-CCHC domain-containing protein [Cephalotus follicularis]|uniref:Zf-CCHC domain-containing protein n=1 Tax=Cephalotus follicularis TaxID=3775 RepID=A0A1Q3C3E5_CEPFO|nr:zf-CCHC domain-containing protein [Cephalotus follicularis]
MNHESEETKKKKTIALKASKEENEDVGDEDREMALITTQFKKFLRQQRKRPFKKHLQKDESSKKEEVICYECNKPGHYKNYCPKLKKNKEHSKKKKAMMATWSDNDDSSSVEESNGEVANIAFMAIENEDENEVQFSYSFDELHLVEYCEILSLKYSSLKKLNKALSCKIDELKTSSTLNNKDRKKIDDLEKENDSLS